LLTVVAAAIAAGCLLGYWARLGPQRTAEFCALVLAAMLVSAFSARTASSDTRATMPASFVIEFIALVLFGAHAATLVAIVAVAARAFADSERPPALLRTLTSVVTVAAATQAAGYVHQSLGGTLRQFSWPFQAVPIGGALVAYASVTLLSSEVVRPIFAKQRIHPSWQRILLDGSTYVIGAGIAVAMAELIAHRAWEVMPVIALPLWLALRTYNDYLGRLHDESRRREVIDSLDEGMCVVDSNGRITLWNDALERIAGVPRAVALGESLVRALPILARTELAAAVDEALKDRTRRTIADLRLSRTAGAGALQVRVCPVSGGVTLLWRDLTEDTKGEQALKRSEERLALAADGAHDGWWEWNLRTKEFYVSARWKELVGIAGEAGVGGPEDWLNRVHPEDTSALKAALKAHLSGQTPYFQHEHRILHQDGTYRTFLCRGIAAPGTGQAPGRLAGSLTDTTDHARAREQLRSAGFRDSLTGLRNRADFVEMLGRRLEEFKRPRQGARRFAILYLDLDRFKVVNDSLGHLVGDEMLIAVSRRLESCLRDGDTLARIGGDEFAILLHTIGDELQANAFAFSLQETLSKPMMVAGREVFTTASIGIAFGASGHNTPDEIIRDADTAMYHAKSRGKARHEMFDADLHARTRDRLDLENDLRHAVDKKDFEVFYQPIVLLDSGMCVGFESLIRWTRDGKAVSPATFVPMAEELGLIDSLGTWILQQVCQQFAVWKKRYPDAGLDYVTVNVSSRQLMQQNFLRIVEQALEKSGLKPRDVRLEITETALMDSPAAAAQVLRQLREFGAKIYLDDFGTGYSSLSHLHKLPVDALKIDRSFVTTIGISERPAIVESILALARTMNTSVVAEGVESDVQARELERLGCTHAQGYLFSRPLSATAAEEVIAAHRPLGPNGAVAAVSPDDDPYYSSKPFKWPETIAAQ
jgi:diguanylate cyclase (GGDEF)-like protein/PAS domain S-box-containing protein